jgi:cytoskeletal protein CcmA (bactofilin family)
LHVSGSVRGNIVAVKRVTLAPSAHIQGDIRTPSLTIQEGAQISGKIDVGPIRAREPAPASEPAKVASPPAGEAKLM